MEIIAKALVFISNLVGGYAYAIIFLSSSLLLLNYNVKKKVSIERKKQNRLDPLIKEIEEKYKDDKEGMTEALYKLYEDNNVKYISYDILLIVTVFLRVFLLGSISIINNNDNMFKLLKNPGFLAIENIALPLSKLNIGFTSSISFVFIIIVFISTITTIINLINKNKEKGSLKSILVGLITSLIPLCLGLISAYTFAQSTLLFIIPTFLMSLYISFKKLKKQNKLKEKNL